MLRVAVAAGCDPNGATTSPSNAVAKKSRKRRISAIDAFDYCNIIRARSMRFSIAKL
jgi:hypothetical protein